MVSVGTPQKRTRDSLGPDTRGHAIGTIGLVLCRHGRFSTAIVEIPLKTPLYSLRHYQAGLFVASLALTNITKQAGRSAPRVI